MMIGRVTGRTVEKNRDGDGNVLMLQVEMTENDDVQSVELIRQSGEDYNPQDDAAVVVVPISEALQVAVACDDGVQPEVEPGERKLYSVDAGAIKAYIKLVLDGILELNGNAYHAVRYEELQTAFNTLKQEFDTYAATHLHLGGLLQGGLTGVATPPPVPSQAQIEPSKVDTVKFP